MICGVEVFHGKVSVGVERVEDKTLDVRCSLILLIESSPTAKLKVPSVDGLGTVMMEEDVDDLSCMVTDTTRGGFCVVSKETPGLTLKGKEKDECANV